jgi:hypothetical protein
MGLIHSRASKKRDRAQAALLKEERRQLAGARHRDDHEERVEQAGDSVLRQPTVRDALGKLAERRRGRDSAA